MKHFRKQLAVWTSTALLGSAFAAMPAQAAADTVPDAIYAETVCADFAPLYEDEIIVHTSIQNSFSVRIVQHSPERENLVLYDSDFAGTEATNYVFRAEPGDYTAYITVDAVLKSAVKRTYTQDFTIANPDYVTGDDVPFTKTRYGFVLSLSMISGDTAADPELTDTQSGVTNEIYAVANAVNFKRYTHFRGDYDGDSETDVIDAMFTLAEYTASIAEVQSDHPADAEQTAACDIDGDGSLTVIDAMHILSFSTMRVAGLIPRWPDGLSDGRYEK